MTHGFPRYFWIAGTWINSYQVLLCVGIYLGSLATAFVAQQSGLSPLRLGMAAALSALAGLVGARAYHVVLNLGHYMRTGWRGVWDRQRGGWSVFGALLTFVPATWLAAWILAVSPATLWDHMSAGVLVGGFWIRLGCVFNGCCGGRETTRRFGVWLHDTDGVRLRRLPVQYLEMAWWAIGLALFVRWWPLRAAAGSYALGVLAWYGTGRAVLEPMRERSDTFGRVRVDQLVAVVLALTAGGTLILRR
jgi:phosphatidylglycerol:prolipoprotein diacylglycerol transferase